MKQQPKLGSIVSIQHVTEQNKSGLVHYKGAHSFSEQKITKLYMNGRVQVESGDVWDITPMGNGKFRTVPFLHHSNTII